jgi:hypothetical protein
MCASYAFQRARVNVCLLVRYHGSLLHLNLDVSLVCLHAFHAVAA